AAKAVADMLGRAKTRGVGLRLAALSLSPALVPTLQAVIEAKVTPAERARAASLLAQMGTDEAVSALVPLLGRPELATVAALGLAKSPSGVAASALARGLADSQPGAPRRLMMRAAILRELVGNSPVSGLRRMLGDAASSESVEDRAVAAFGQVALGARSLAGVATSESPEVRAAARRAALVLGAAALRELRPALVALSGSAAPAPLEQTELAAALLVGAEQPGERVATSVLARWAEEGSLISPLAAYRLAALDSAPYRSRLRALLSGTDPAVRAHVALGLAHSPEPDATALLAERYRFETEPSVRAAVVRALSRRPERLREHTLALAEMLDPDATVRALARSARAGRKHPIAQVPAGRDFAWVTLRPNGVDHGSERRRGALLLRSDGLALPAVSDPDGVLLVGGLSSTDALQLRLQPVD
ncbi:MAG TPA: HEAT repeat domain-containing protein, partial [Polyangiaceae bacterium]|nr:HEAT repeat domain-containing protein [Polyangiaceae bacterium]